MLNVVPDVDDINFDHNVSCDDDSIGKDDHIDDDNGDGVYDDDDDNNKFKLDDSVKPWWRIHLCYVWLL